MATEGAGISSTACVVAGFSETLHAEIEHEGAGLSRTAAVVAGAGGLISPEGAGVSSTAAIVSGAGTFVALSAPGVSSTAAIVSGAARVDAVQQSQNPKTYALRIVNVRIGANGILEYDLVREDLSIYQARAPAPLLSAGLLGGSPSTVPDDDAPGLRLPGATRVQFLDIPALTFEDREPGFYVAMTGTEDGWRGAALYEKVGSEYLEVASSGDRSVIAIADAALGAGAVTTFNGSGRTFVFDDTNTVDVELIDKSGELVSVSEADQLAGRNAAAVGIAGRWEIISFGTATQLAAGVYRLGHLLRGLKGTEWAVATHGTGEIFVLLDESLRRVSDEPSGLGVARTFRVASIGTSFDAAADRIFTNSGVSSKPLAPVYVRGEEDADGNRILRWYRRSRIDGLAGREGTAAPPLGEESERYEIEILNGAGSAVLRTLTATSEFLVYTVGQQTEDFGTPPASLNVRVYQISADVGRGYPASATLSSFTAGAIPTEDLAGQPFRAFCTVLGRMPDGKDILIVPVTDAVVFPEDFAGSRGKATGAAAAASTVFSIRKNGVEIGTMTFASGQSVATFASSAEVLFDPSAGDVLSVRTPTPPDTGLADLGFGLAGERI